MTAGQFSSLSTPFEMSTQPCLPFWPKPKLPNLSIQKLKKFFQFIKAKMLEMIIGICQDKGEQ